MSDVHKHRCGYEWEHERIFLNSDDYANRHLCPRCGAGPWFRRLLSLEDRKRFSERVPSVLATVETEQELVLVAGSILDVLGFDAVRFEQIEKRLHELRRK